MQVLITTSPLAWVASPPRSPNTVKPSSRTSTIASGMLHHALRDDLAAADGHDDPTAYPPPLKRRVLATAPKGRRVNPPFGIRIDQDPLVLERLAGDLTGPRYSGTVDGASVEAEPEHDANRGLEAMEAVRACLLGRQLVRRVVGRDRIDDPFDERVAQGITIVRAPQRRIDIAVWTHGPHVTRAQCQMVRRGFGRHR